MARKLLIRTNEFPYHITARANNKDFFPLPKEDCWDIFCKTLAETQKKYNLHIHAFMMMSNHLHLIVSTPDSNIDKAMHYFMTTTSKTIGFLTKRINRLWGARYYRSIIMTPEYYAHAYKYLFSNPIRANMVQSVEDYPWSTLRGRNYLKHRDQLKITPFKALENYLPTTEVQMLAWLNHQDDLFYVDQVRRALKKNVFQFSNDEGVKIYDNFRKFLLKN